MSALRSASTAVALVALFTGVTALPVRAQGATPAPAAASAEALFANAAAEEAAVRKVLSQASPAATVFR